MNNPHLPAKFVYEMIERDQKRQLPPYESYTPNYKRELITSKFYSKDWNDAIVDHVDADLVNRVYKANDYGPKDKQEWPETVNQSYGWFSRPVDDVDRNDRRLYCPKVNSSMTTIGLMALKEKMVEKKFSKKTPDAL